MKTPFLVFALGVLVAAFSAVGGERDVIINEIMYHPPDDRDGLQFIELFNRGDAAVDLSGWSFTKGIKFTFPANTSFAPGAFLVVCRELQEFTERYGQDVSVLGNFDGSLSHQGERVELSNARRQVIDSVKYSDHGDWPLGADGYSAALERICPHADSGGAENWASSKLPRVVSPAGTPGKRNDSFSTNLPPIISNVRFAPPAPGEPTAISATVSDADGLKSVTLLHRLARAGKESAETSTPMKRVSGDERKGVYEAVIDGVAAGALVRFRIQAVDGSGAARFQPAENEPRPTYSYCTLANTNTATVPFGFVLHLAPAEQRLPGGFLASRFAQMMPSFARGLDAFIYMPPGGGPAQTFDHVHVTPRKGGFKIRFHHDQTLRGMTTVNIIFEGSPRWVLSEPLAYELYRMAGVPAVLTEHIRVWIDGRLQGYQLLIEQPNKSFLTRHDRDDSGNLYKLLWYGSGIVGQHEKKTHPHEGHDDLLALIEGLDQTQGAAQWEFIQKSFNVEEVINYFAVNMCIQNWDGFFNNYYAYHDTGGSGKWEMYPWDEDKTWGDFDGASLEYDWYSMPLTFGMNTGTGQSPDRRAKGRSAPGFDGGALWWRPPGYFSGPLLANTEFRQRFLARLREICTTIFTKEKLFPVLDAMEMTLAPEIRVRTEAEHGDAERALKEFHHHMQTFRNQVVNRRKFILAELEQAR